MTFRVLAWLVLGSGSLVLVGALALLGDTPVATAEGRHLRKLKNRTEAPDHVEPITMAAVQALPHGLPLARRAAFESRGVVMEGWNQRMIVAGDGDVHLELTPAPRGPESPDTAYVTAEITPRWRAGHAGWSLERLLEVFRPNTGGATPWDSGPRRVRVSGWLFYDSAYDAIPSAWSLAHRSARVSGWEIHPVTRIEAWDEARRAFVEIAR